MCARCLALPRAGSPARALCHPLLLRRPVGCRVLERALKVDAAEASYYVTEAQCDLRLAFEKARQTAGRLGALGGGKKHRRRRRGVSVLRGPSAVLLGRPSHPISLFPNYPSLKKTGDGNG